MSAPPAAALPWYRDYPITAALFGVYLALALAVTVTAAAAKPRRLAKELVSPAVQTLMDYGALVSTRVLRDREYWRLATATLLHGGLIHLAINSLALIQLGRVIEAWYGGAALVVLHLVLGVLANLVSLWAHDSIVQVGASGALFGLLALIGTCAWKSRSREGVRIARQVVFWIVINVAFGHWLNADNAAHLGGVLSGILVGLFFPPCPAEEHGGDRLPWTYGKGMRLLAAVSAAGFILAFGLQARSAAEDIRQRSAARRQIIQLPQLLDQQYRQVADARLRQIFHAARTDPGVLEPARVRQRLATELEHLAEALNGQGMVPFLTQCRRLLLAADFLHPNNLDRLAELAVRYEAWAQAEGLRDPLTGPIEAAESGDFPEIPPPR